MRVCVLDFGAKNTMVYELFSPLKRSVLMDSWLYSPRVPIPTWQVLLRRANSCEDTVGGAIVVIRFLGYAAHLEPTRVLTFRAE
jgi:hypothetical protein